jgi:hypothetical protein
MKAVPGMQEEGWTSDIAEQVRETARHNAGRAYPGGDYVRLALSQESKPFPVLAPWWAIKAFRQPQGSDLRTRSVILLVIFSFRPIRQIAIDLQTEKPGVPAHKAS